jgi:hypothetical protein
VQQRRDGSADEGSENEQPDLLRGTASAGWVALTLSLGVLGVVVAVIIQLLLGRRNWLDRVASSRPVYSPFAHAIGAGVWIAGAATIALVANACTYLVRVYLTWRDQSATSANGR